MNAATFLFLLSISSSCYHATSGAQILALFPYIGKSHFYIFEPYIKELASRGHQVVVVSHFPQKKSIPNYRDISIAGSVEIAAVDRLDLGKLSGFELVLTLTKEANNYIESCNKALSFHTVQDLLKSEETFDLIITENFLTDCFLPFVDKFHTPFIAISTSPLFPWAYDRMGNPDNPSFVASMMTWFDDRMSFSERLTNSLINFLSRALYYIKESLITQNQVRAHFGNNVPLLSDIARNTSLILVNTHFSLNQPRPLVPGIVEIGGIHIRTPKKLPKDLEDFLIGAEHGAIYFSLGSMIRADSLSTEKRDAFIQAFSELPQRVLWKWEGDSLPGQPENVMISKWLPQFDILSHPNVRVFIGHCGLLGAIEAMHVGVPVLAIPIYADQPMNARAMESSGIAIHLTYENITKDSLLQALRSLLQEPRYRERAQQMSKIFKDRPMSPMDTAIFWTEYIIRHKGAPHLRSAALDLTWYQYFLLDVIAVMFLCLVSTVYCIYFIAKKLIRIFNCNTRSKFKQI